MKLKIRFDTKDLQKFLIVCLVVFYIICLAVANLATLTSTGGFSGLNPFPALTSDMFLTTVVFYIIAIVALLVSCKSYFFEFEEGFGFATDKKLDGYSKWASERDMKKAPKVKKVKNADFTSEAAGIPLINDGKYSYVDDGEYHNLIIGSTGSGKTQCIIFPMIELLSKHGESMILTDPKGELFEKKSNMLRAKGYKIAVLNFRDPGKGAAWNPMALPYKLFKSGNRDKAIELLDDLALNILYDEGNKNADPFWEKTSADYFSGLALSLFNDATEDEVNLNSISLMTTAGEEKLGGSTYIKEYFNSKDPNSPEYINASSTILAPSDTKMSILSVFKQKIKLFASRENLSEMLSYSTFNIEEIGKKKTAVFIIIQDEKKTYHSLVTILLKQIYETLIDVAQNNKGKLPVRTNFLLDEFANMPPLKDVTTMITAARSRRMRFTFIIQNFAQLNSVYGEQDAETIKGNCGNMIYLISGELKALEEISKLCGDVKVKIKSKKENEPDREETRPLITISDLQRMKEFEVIVRRMRQAPLKTYLTPEFKTNWGKKYREASIVELKERPKREVKVFDVREYVKKLKQESNPFAGGSAPGGFNPFASSNPFASGGGGGLFGGPSQFQPPMPSPSRDFASTQSSDDNFSSSIDVERLLKNIDAKIAELEAEEKQAQENMANQEDDSIIDEDFDSEFKKLVEDMDEDLEFIKDSSSNNFQEEKSNTNSINNIINKINDNNQSITNVPDASITNERKDLPSNNNNLEQRNNIRDTKYTEVNNDEFFDDFFE